MAPTLATTASEAESLILANLDYAAGDGSLTKAEQVVASAEAWLILNPGRATHGGRGGEEIQLNVEQVENLLERALEWKQSYYADSGNKFYDFSDYRS